MGNCAGTDDKGLQEIDLYLKKHHKGDIKPVRTPRHLPETETQEPTIATTVDQQPTIDESEAQLLVNVSNKLQKRNRLPKKQPIIEQKQVISYTITHLNADYGTNGRPRVRDPALPPPPMYELVDLFNPHEEILFQGELAKYKACIKPGFNIRWLVVTPNAVRYYKGRCNAVACCNRPLMAFPTKAIKDISIGCNIGKSLTSFEILLKDDFLDTYLRQDYEQSVLDYPQHTTSHSHTNQSIDHRALATEPTQIAGRNNSTMVTPFKSFNASNVHEYSPYRSSFIKEHATSKITVQCKIRMPNGDTRAMSTEEVKKRYMEQIEGHSAQSQTGFGKQAEWFVTNKRLIFAAKNADLMNEWVERLRTVIVE
ncbi:hypothetical protein FGO68_gene3654 [Halteria grandinella]|uniref:PH domain-containing protein n=1 Tax=Halteria grandinella TaxID=5974 RepID=A0A8J8P1X7_HALGN|nr:hypothetical protein FGO68_gene3654 [Halteria grandinella]